MLVGVRGAGIAYDGLYYVDSVSNTDQAPANSSRAFKLSRDGLIAASQRVAGYEPGDRKFFGKYRGTVVNNIDPERRGRLMIPGERCL